MQQKIAAKSFEEEPVCKYIIHIANVQNFKSQMDYSIYADFALGIEQLTSLRTAVDNHFGNLTSRLKQLYPALNNDDIDYCCLYLLGLKNADISALMQRSYRAICDRDKKLKSLFDTNEAVGIFLRNITN